MCIRDRIVFVGIRRVAERYIIPYAERVFAVRLHRDREQSVNRALVKRSTVLAAVEKLALVVAVQSEQQLGERGFARAVRTDDADLFTRFDLQAYVFQHLSLIHI